jgi:hypothetical protein
MAVPLHVAGLRITRGRQRREQGQAAEKPADITQK